MRPGRPRHLSLLDALRLRHRRLGRDEGGQVMLMTAILALAFIMFVASILPVGQTITARIQAQNAADAAATMAVTWMSRGANFLQGTNGFHWDVDGIMVIVIEGITYYYIAQICEHASDPFTWILIPFDWIHGREKIGKATDAEKYMAESIEGCQVMAEAATPMAAFSYASQVAKANGADVLTAADFDTVAANLPGVPAGFSGAAFNDGFSDMRHWLKDGEFGQGLLNWLRDRGVHLSWGIGCLLNWIIPNPHGEIDADSFKPCAWPVNPSLKPSECLKFAEAEAAGGWGMTSPLCTEFWWPFALSLVFIEFVDWNENYYKSANVDVPITFMTVKAPGASFMLDSLLRDPKSHSATVTPRVYAFGAARMTGDNLEKAGQTGAIYISTPIFAIPIWPFPLLRVFLGYDGNFKCQSVPVKVLGTEGKDMLIMH